MLFFQTKEKWGIFTALLFEESLLLLHFGTIIGPKMRILSIKSFSEITYFPETYHFPETDHFPELIIFGN